MNRHIVEIQARADGNRPPVTKAEKDRDYLLLELGRIRSQLDNMEENPPVHDKDWGTLEENGWERAITMIRGIMDGRT